MHSAASPEYAVSDSAFRSAAGLFASGVTIVTRLLPDAEPYGMTVSSFTTVSLHPPLILVCIDHTARFLQDFPPNLAFAVNILAEDQQHIATRFADRKQEKRFTNIDWTPGWRGIPLVTGVVASFACALHQKIESGDHSILIGEVHEIRRHQGKPLIWCDRGYHHLPPVV